MLHFKPISSCYEGIENSYYLTPKAELVFAGCPPPSSEGCDSRGRPDGRRQTGMLALDSGSRSQPEAKEVLNSAAWGFLFYLITI